MNDNEINETDIRAKAKELAARYPGRSVELRIPPYIALQLGIGEDRGDHRRGTPPSVVEIPPGIFLALCAGGLTWDECRTQISASGIRADLSGLFPL